jgi:hypothetical protein
MENETRQEGGPDPQTTKMPTGTKICIFILAIVLIFYIMGCSNDFKSTTQTSNNKDSLYISKWGASIIPINGCQYALFRDISAGGIAMVHAGNCNNSEHKIK